MSLGRRCPSKNFHFKPRQAQIRHCSTGKHNLCRMPCKRVVVSDLCKQSKEFCELILDFPLVSVLLVGKWEQCEFDNEAKRIGCINQGYGDAGFSLRKCRYFFDNTTKPGIKNMQHFIGTSPKVGVSKVTPTTFDKIQSPNILRLLIVIEDVMLLSYAIIGTTMAVALSHKPQFISSQWSGDHSYGFLLAFGIFQCYIISSSCGGILFFTNYCTIYMIFAVHWITYLKTMVTINIRKHGRTDV